MAMASSPAMQYMRLLLPPSNHYLLTAFIQASCALLDERTDKLIEDHQDEEMTPFIRALCCDD